MYLLLSNLIHRQLPFTGPQTSTSSLLLPSTRIPLALAARPFARSSDQSSCSAPTYTHRRDNENDDDALFLSLAASPAPAFCLWPPSALHNPDDRLTDRAWLVTLLPLLIVHSPKRPVRIESLNSQHLPVLPPRRSRSPQFVIRRVLSGRTFPPPIDHVRRTQGTPQKLSGANHSRSGSLRHYAVVVIQRGVSEKGVGNKNPRCSLLFKSKGFLVRSIARDLRPAFGSSFPAVSKSSAAVVLETWLGRRGKSASQLSCIGLFSDCAESR